MIAEFLHQYRGHHEARGELAAVDYRRCSIDSRTIVPGEMFVALRGEVHDGHLYAAAAAKTASAVVVEAAWEQAHGADLPAGHAAVIVVDDTLDFLQQLGAWHRRKFELPLIGITGSNGKTTTREMIAAVLGKKYRVFQSEGNKNNHIGLPLMLLKLAGDAEVAVLELGTNHPGEIAHLSALAGPTVAVITNIGTAHIGFFGTREAIYEEKTALFRALGEGGALFLNLEDPFLQRYPREAHRGPVITVGLAPGCDVRGSAAGADRLGRMQFRINDSITVRLQVPGRHNLMNGLLAAAVGMHFQVDGEAIREALEHFQPVKQRMQLLEKDGVRIINDAYNANPDSMRAAVDYLLQLKARPRIAVLGDMLELGEFAESEHRELGAYLARRAVDMVLLYGPLARFIESGIRDSGGNMPVFHCRTHDEIAAHLRRIIARDTVVLLKGSRGMAMEKVLALL